MATQDWKNYEEMKKSLKLGYISMQQMLVEGGELGWLQRMGIVVVWNDTKNNTENTSGNDNVVEICRNGNEKGFWII